MAKARKRKFPGPWRLTHKELHDDFVVSLTRDRLSVRMKYTYFYKRTCDRWGNKEERREEVHGPDFHYMLEKLQMTDHEANILMMMEAGVGVVRKLAQRWNFYVWREGLKDKERRKREYAKKKEGWAEQKVAKQLSEVHKGLKKEKKPCRRVEV